MLPKVECPVCRGMIAVAQLERHKGSKACEEMKKYRAERCEGCGMNYRRTTCDACGKKICLHCARAVNESRVECKLHLEEQYNESVAIPPASH